jgi:hypothetical protein
MQKCFFSLLVIFVFNTFNLYAQSRFPYESKWKEITELIEKNDLPKSALQKVNELFEAAKKEKNEPQQLKALIWRLNLQEQFNEEKGIASILQLEAELKEAKEPIKSILHSLTAEAYRQYLDHNRWKIYDRKSSLSGTDKEKIDMWSIKDFHKIINEHFIYSTAEYEILSSINLKSFEPLLEKGNAGNLRPTIFDLLAHRAIEYYEEEERNIVTEDLFNLDHNEFWISADDFIKMQINAQDLQSPLFHATSLYKKLISLHYNNNRREALIDVDLKRIKFLERFSNLQDKKERYRHLLNEIIRKYSSTTDVSQAAYWLASSYCEDAKEYHFKKHPLNDSSNPRWLYLKAYAICKPYTALNTNSEGISNCKNLLQEISEKKLQFEVEEVNIPDQPFRMLVSYRNTPQLWIRVIPITDKILSDFENDRWSEENWRKLAAYTPSISFMQLLPASEDFQTHQTEIGIPALQPGQYALIVSNNENFTTENNLLAMRGFFVSNLSWIRNGKKLFILNRETGSPITNAKVQIWKNHYDYEKGKYEMKKGKSYFSINDGSVDLTTDSLDNDSEYIEVIYQSDRLMTASPLQLYSWNGNEQIKETGPVYKNAFFTDRAIYRPGQVVQFKGILLAISPDKKRKLSNDEQVQVFLYNANNQAIDSLLTKTNNYGSYAGRFTIPEGELPGNYKLTTRNKEGEVFFMVEEYKRPKFLVQIDPPKKAYKVHDTISVKGEVLSYSGFAISNAQIRYRIVRKPNLPYPWLCYRWGWPLMNEKEIISGSTAADKYGNFLINFPALPDLSIRKELNPLFNYEITAEATDLNGETQNTTSNIQAGYQSIILSIQTPGNGTIYADSLKSINISTRNMMNVFESVKTTLKIFRLKNNNRLLRKRYWDQPDQYTMTESDYRKMFPWDEYKNENEKEGWDKENRITEITSLTREDKPFDLKNIKWQPGWYQAEATTFDKNGEPIQQTVFFEVRSGKNESPVDPVWFWHSNNHTLHKPGETVFLNIGSDAENIYLIKNSNNTLKNETNWKAINLKKQVEDKIIFSKISDQQYSLTYSFVKQNRFYQFTKQFEVRDNNHLEIKVESFRDKTKPGAEEEWRIRIKDQKGVQNKSEVLTTMYDASLDVFNKNEWLFPTPDQQIIFTDDWQTGGFSHIQSYEKSFIAVEWAYTEKTYDRLPGLNLFYSFYSMKTNQAVSADITILQKGKENLDKENDKDVYADSAKAEQTEIRKNFQETAFFYPQLQTDTSGQITLRFKIPDAITRWNWRILAHTEESRSAYLQKEIITRKELMTEPYVPRFLREGDQMIFTVRITNTGNSELSGPCRLELFRKGETESVDGWFQNLFPVQYFSVEPGSSTLVKFPIVAPYYFQDLLTFRVTAVSNMKNGYTVSDGEQGVIPVLSDRLFITETLPVFLKSGESKLINWKSLLASDSSETIRHQSIVAEFTSNPIWAVVQSLPYLAEKSNESVDMLWNRFYANAIASNIANQYPQIKKTIDQWQVTDSTVLLSQLDKNSELKALLLKETPWIADAESERNQRQNIKILFDEKRIRNEQNKALINLINHQAPSGGFIWTPGGREDRYMTQYIISGIGQLLKINAISDESLITLQPVIEKALNYLDQKLIQDYEAILKSKLNTKKYQPGHLEIELLYMRSFFKNISLSKGTEKAFRFYTKQAKATWAKQPLYLRAYILMTLQRNGDLKTAVNIHKSIKEKAVNSPEKGIYFPSGFSLYSYQTNEEIQSILIEAFSEYNKDLPFVEGMKTWLLQQKRVQQWSNNKATAKACYVLLQQGNKWHEQENVIRVSLGDTLISSENELKQSGTGYFKKTYPGEIIESSWGKVNINANSKTGISTPVWGSLYWQYTDKIENIQAGSSTLSVSRLFFRENIQDNKTVLLELDDTTTINPGDKIIVRWVIKNDRLLEYVGMKDLRAACLEPVDKTSGYRWKDGIGYYESIRDAGSELFFDQLPAGTFILESAFYVTHRGNFSSGYTSVQCLYAPEISAQSDGGKIKVEGQ